VPGSFASGSTGTDAVIASEITDKGYLHQRKVLTERAALVELTYTDPASGGVVVPARTAR
jgi:hypothetical protein